MSPNRLITGIFTVALLASLVLVIRPGANAAPVRFASRPSGPVHLLPASADILAALATPNPFGLVEPVAQFKDRITKKTYGMYITPGTSPVENDRFTGFHTGVDAEFSDTPVDIPVVAVADGVVVVSKWATGYGGVLVLEHTIPGIPRFSLYGHLDPASLLHVGTVIAQGGQLGILGDGNTPETDGVRKHLHFDFYTGEKFDIRGYVPTEAELSPWADPMDYF